MTDKWGKFIMIKKKSFKERKDVSDSYRKYIKLKNVAYKQSEIPLMVKESVDEIEEVFGIETLYNIIKILYRIRVLFEFSPDYIIHIRQLLEAGGLPGKYYNLTLIHECLVYLSALAKIYGDEKSNISNMFSFQNEPDIMQSLLIYISDIDLYCKTSVWRYVEIRWINDECEEK
nr:MAG TPA: hypothetical protein [Caudoviricetes sp.]